MKKKKRKQNKPKPAKSNTLKQNTSSTKVTNPFNKNQQICVFLQQKFKEKEILNWNLSVMTLRLIKKKLKYQKSFKL